MRKISTNVFIFSLYLAFIFLIASCSSKESEISEFVIDFEKSSIGRYTPSKISRDWPNASMQWGKLDRLLSKLDLYSNPIEVECFNNNVVLRVNFQANRFGPVPGTQWKSIFKKTEEVMLSYEIFIPNDFDFVKGGKLPGLAGGFGNTGGCVPTGYDGWSARLMFLENGEVAHYLYHPDQPGKYGDYKYWTIGQERVVLPKGQWVKLTHYIKMNDPVQSNGIIQAWLNETIVLSVSNIRFREDANLGIDQILFSTFFGGNSLDWAPKTDTYILFDNFNLWQPAEISKK